MPFKDLEKRRVYFRDYMRKYREKKRREKHLERAKLVFGNNWKYVKHLFEPIFE